MKVLFICTGNTCRSPMAETILRKKAEERNLNCEVSSCGLQVIPGSVMSENAKNALAACGYSAGDFKSRQGGREFYAEADLIVCMTPLHKYYVSGYKNVYTVAEITGGKDVSDPYGSCIDEYISCLRELETACDAIIEKFYI